MRWRLLALQVGITSGIVLLWHSHGVIGMLSAIAVSLGVAVVLAWVLTDVH
jgi:hypothetical protein